jgi:prenyltransferase beta subunit
MALTALSGYRDREEVNAAIEKAVACLSSLQQADGGYLSWGVPCAESSAQVLLALCALEIGTDDVRFVKNGRTVLDNLLSFQRPDGGFAHDADTQDVDQMSTEQALLALAAVRRASLGQSFLFDLTNPVRTGILSFDFQNSGADRCSLIFYYRKNKPVWVITP